MINKLDNSPTFGWRYKMHSAILEAGGKNFKYHNYKVMPLLQEMVERPDFDETFLFSQKHFYYPNSKIKSFFDLTGKGNAKSAYEKHIGKFKELFDEFPLYALDEAAKALHYLQDVTQPQHIDSSSVIKKISDRTTHKKFEQHALDKSKSLLKQVRPAQLKSRTFETLFDDTVNLSSKNRVPTKDNQELWTAIAYDGTNVAVGATKRFFELLTTFIKSN